MAAWSVTPLRNGLCTLVLPEACEARQHPARRRIMPITFGLDVRASLIRTIGSGQVTPAEVAAHFSQLSKAWPPGAKLDVLLDLSGCTSLPELPQLREVVSLVDALGGRKRFGRCAIVATRELLYGLMRVFEFLADQKFSALRVFRSEPDAMAWLRERSPTVRQYT